MRLIIDIPEERYKRIVKSPRCVDFNEAVEDRTVLVKALQNGIPLDDVKAEIITERHNLADAKDWGRYYGLGIALEILDNIGKAEREE